jgi:fatty acid desaturase
MTDPWYRCEIDRALLKSLSRRTNWHGLVYLFYFIALLIITGFLVLSSVGTLWSIPAFLLYGGIWVFATSVVHETSHGTAFRNRALNETVLFLSGFMVQQTPCLLRYVHARHHSHTALVGEDPEIILTNPMTWRDFIVKELIDLGSIWYFVKAIAALAIGRPTQDAADCIPAAAMRRAVIEAQAYMLGYLAIIFWSLAAQSWLPVLMLILPRVLGAPVHGVMLATQHIGMAQDIPDHRHTTRTMIVNPVLRMLYWNMNYHIEHHVFPQIPFHALPALHAAVGDQCPPPTRGVFGAIAEIATTLNRQRRNSGYTTPRPLPSSASS